MCEKETQNQDLTRKLWHLIPKKFTTDEQKKFNDFYQQLCELTHNYADDEVELSLMTRAAKELGLYSKFRCLINELTNIK